MKTIRERTDGKGLLVRGFLISVTLVQISLAVVAGWMGCSYFSMKAELAVAHQEVARMDSIMKKMIASPVFIEPRPIYVEEK